MIRNWTGQSGSSGWWLVDRMPWNAVGLQPRIQHFVFVCFWETVVWCYCDRKWESWEWGNGEGRCLCGSPVKSLCPWRAALLQGSTEKRAAFVCLMGLRASSYSDGLGSVNSDCGLELYKCPRSLSIGDLTECCVCCWERDICIYI